MVVREDEPGYCPDCRSPWVGGGMISVFSADSQGRLDPRILDYLYAAHPNWRIVPETEEVSMIEHEADYV